MMMTTNEIVLLLFVDFWSRRDKNSIERLKSSLYDRSIQNHDIC
jgi:hypothetical protein